MNFRQMLRILSRAPKPTQAQLAQAEKMLRRAGYEVKSPAAPTRWNGGRVSPQPSPFTRRKPAPGQTAPLPLPGWEERVQPSRDTSDDDLLAGTMYDVESSNVHSIGMRIENPGDTKGQLLVRFLGQHEGGVRSGMGALYGYDGVSVHAFRDFQHAGSKGGWVWDHLRVRGTVAGHRFPYELLGVTSAFIASMGKRIENYVPRQAALKRGQSGQHFVNRTFRVGEIRGGRMRSVSVESQLRPQQASLRGPNPSRGPGASSLRLLGGR